jgi:AcrR family transcriptional regulator
MEEIARAAGIGRATLYRYFPNRRERLRTSAGVSGCARQPAVS